MYYIYHIPGIKIGCTTNINARMSDQGFTNWEILEEYNDGWLAGDRELQLQKEYGYPVDRIHYMISCKHLSTARPNWSKTGSQSNRGKRKRQFTYDIAEQIRNEYQGPSINQHDKKLSYVDLAKKYNTTKKVIGDIIKYNTYTEA